MNREYANDRLKALLRDLPFYTADEFRRQMERILAGATGEKDAGRVRVELAEAKARIAQLEELIRDAPVSSGVCCCGEDMEGHSHSNHTPVDLWDDAVMEVLG